MINQIHCISSLSDVRGAAGASVDGHMRDIKAIAAIW